MDTTSRGPTGPHNPPPGPRPRLELELAGWSSVPASELEGIRRDAVDALAAVRRLAGWYAIGGAAGPLEPALELLDVVAVGAREELERRIRELPAAGSSEEPLLVRVELLNDAGDRQTLTVRGRTVDAAVWSAQDMARSAGDDSWVMTEWRAVGG